MADPIGPRWFSLWPPVFWIINVLIFPWLLSQSKNLVNAQAPPIGPPMSAKGDVPKEANRKGYVLGAYPVFLVASVVLGLLDDAMKPEPNLDAFLRYFTLPFAIFAIWLHAMINFRRSHGLHTGDSFTLVMCTLFQVPTIGVWIIWGAYVIIASEPGGSLAEHASQVRASVGLLFFVCLVIFLSMAFRLVVFIIHSVHEEVVLPK